MNNLKISRQILLIRESLIRYLPMTMLSGLFLFSIWLVRSVNQVQNESSELRVAHIPDYEFQNFNLKTYEINGKLKSSLQGEYAEHFLDTKNMEVKNPYVHIFDENKVTSIKAKKAIVNEDGSQVQLIGQTLLKRENQLGNKVTMQISSDFLHFYSKTDTVTTHLPVKITHGNNHFSADRLEADNINQVFELSGKVRAILASK